MKGCYLMRIDIDKYCRVVIIICICGRNLKVYKIWKLYVWGKESFLM